MKALIIGKPAPLQTVIEEELISYDYEVTLTNNREKLPDQDFDICIDMSATGIRDIKRVTVHFNEKKIHYILISTCGVYPSTPRLSPWRTDEIDLCDETGFNTVDITTCRSRAAERELKHLGSRIIPWTILRPAIVEVKSNPDEKNMWWFVSRVIDGGPIVLPDDDDQLFRHISDVDLARAIRIIARRKETFSQTINVASHTLLSFESYARLIIKGLEQDVPVVRVSRSRWDAAGLNLPIGRHLHSSFIEDSLLLDQLGWQPVDESQWVREYARYLVENPLAKPTQREAELALLDDISESPFEPLLQELDTWCFVGAPGKPFTFHLEYKQNENELIAPVLRTLKIAMGPAEERFLLEQQSPDTMNRVLGHNALLELMDPGTSAMHPGSLYLPVAQRPCGDPSCSFCATHEPGLAGVTDDGFGAKYVSVLQQHLVSVPSELISVALLADPLASLLSVLPFLLEENDGSVWIFGQKPDALLASFLVQETGSPLVHVDRTKLIQNELSGDLQFMTLQRAESNVRNKSIDKPTIIINLSGAKDGENILVSAIAEGGVLVTPFAETQTHQRRVDIHLPLAAPGRLWLERAIEKLSHWSTYHDLDIMMQPVPLEHFWDLFLSGHFKQPFIDATGVNK